MNKQALGMSMGCPRLKGLFNIYFSSVWLPYVYDGGTQKGRNRRKDKRGDA